MEQTEQDHLPRDQPPSYSLAQSHDPNALNLPSVPTADPPAPPPVHHERTLPPLPLAPVESRYRAEEHITIWPSSNPLTAYYQPGPSQLSPKTGPTMATDLPSRMDVDTPDSRGRRGGSVLSIDDPDVRLAAEALGDLRADFVQSPTQRNMSIPRNSPRNPNSGAQNEPLLSLLTTSHPLLGTAIGGSLSAYSASKNYSPRFKSSAEFLENRFSPVVNTITSVNRMTGVEGGVRWFLGGRRPSHLSPVDSMESGREGSNKRRKVVTDDEETDRHMSYDSYPVHRQDLQHRQRAQSQASQVDSLPAYDEYRSPSYEDTQQALIPKQDSREVSNSNSSWQSFVLSTSGLSVAMSEESLRSLKYCLGWLRWANEHIGKVILALKSVLEQYENPPPSGTTIDSGEGGEKGNSLIPRSEAERIALNAKVAELKKDVLKTLKSVVDIVSKYAGGALPENARILVRKHLTSLPQRFRLANSRTSDQNPRGLEQGDAEVTDGANRVLVLAKEGLDMMAQVSGVLDGTIVSAEEWCEKLGRKKREEQGEEDAAMRHSTMEKQHDFEKGGYQIQNGDEKTG